MTGDPRLSDVIEAIYAGIRTPGGWERALAAAAELLESDKWSLAVGCPAAREIKVLVSHGYPEDAVRAYEQHFVSRDPFFEAFAQCRAGGVFNDGRLPDRETLIADPTYRDFYRANDAVHFLGTWLNDGNGRRPLVLFQRGTRDGFYEDSESEWLKSLLPHFRRALELERTVTELERTRATALELLNRPHMALVFLDAWGGVLETNRSARSILAREDGLHVKDGRLAAAAPADNRRLSEATCRALGSVSGAASPATLGIERPSGRRPYLLEIMPVAHGAPESVGIQPPETQGLVLIQDPEAPWSPDPRVIRSLFGLTGTEARLCLMLTMTYDLRAAAAALGITAGTARWHLKRVFAKTRTQGQAELIALMGRACRF